MGRGDALREWRVTWNEHYKVRPQGVCGTCMGVWYGWLVCTTDGWHVRLDGVTNAVRLTRAEVRTLLGNPRGIDRGPGLDCGRTFAWLEM